MNDNELEKEFQLYGAIIEIEEVLNQLNDLTPHTQNTAHSLSKATDTIKKIAELATKFKHVDIREEILDLKEHLLNARQDLLDIKENLLNCQKENAKLKKIKIHWLKSNK